MEVPTSPLPWANATLTATPQTPPQSQNTTKYLKNTLFFLTPDSEGFKTPETHPHLPPTPPDTATPKKRSSLHNVFADINTTRHATNGASKRVLTSSTFLRRARNLSPYESARPRCLSPSVGLAIRANLRDLQSIMMFGVTVSKLLTGFGDSQFRAAACRYTARLNDMSNWQGRLEDHKTQPMNKIINQFYNSKLITPGVVAKYAKMLEKEMLVTSGMKYATMADDCALLKKEVHDSILNHRRQVTELTLTSRKKTSDCEELEHKTRKLLSLVKVSLEEVRDAIDGFTTGMLDTRVAFEVATFYICNENIETHTSKPIIAVLQRHRIANMTLDLLHQSLVHARGELLTADYSHFDTLCSALGTFINNAENRLAASKN